MAKVLAIFTSALFSVFLRVVEPNYMPVVRTENGLIKGEESVMLGEKVHSFLGVPFAEPPINKLRFRPPNYKKSWNGTYEARTLSPSCFQGKDTMFGTFWGADMWNYNSGTSEDCLYMNIWKPANAQNATVMVWLFGGGYWYGSPSLLLYDGRTLAVTGDVIVVNINYRVGAFGFLFFDHPSVPGNAGMLDQQLALHWIRKNIAAFGGNPESVGLFGESAGAASIVAHLIAPGSRGLFKNGILQSGSLDNRWSMDTPERALEKSLELAGHVGCKKDDNDLTVTMSSMIDCMVSVPAAELRDKLWYVTLNYQLEFPLVTVSRDLNFFKEKDAFRALRDGDMSRDVNIMIGINSDEGNFWNIYGMPKYFNASQQTHPKLTKADFIDCVNMATKGLPLVVREAVKHTYANAKCHNDTVPTKYYAEMVNQLVGDYFFTCDSLWLADQFVNNDYPGKVYIYYFDQPSSANPWPKWTGTMHGYEIEFAFGVPLHNRTAGYSVEEKDLSEMVVHYWSSFSRTGTPSVPHPRTRSEIWPLFTADNRSWMYLRGGPGNVKPIGERKVKECRMWRNARDMEFNVFVKSALSLSATSTLLIGCVFLAAIFRDIISTARWSCILLPYSI